MPAVSDYSPLDRAYTESIGFTPKRPTLEDPIVPIEQIGQTVPEQDPATGANILQNVQAAIRRGAGNIQLVMSTSPDSAIGGRFKAYGPEVREEIRTVLEVNKVKMSSIELPTAISNLSGFDPQQNVFSDERRERDMQEVRDAIKFAAEVAGGGGVDVLSWEYERNLSDAPWNKDKEGNTIFKSPGGPEHEHVQIVNSVTGRISTIRKGEPVFLAFDPKTFDPSIPEDQWISKFVNLDAEGLPKVQPWKWEDFVAVTKRTQTDPDKQDPIQLFIMLQQNSQIASTEGYARHYARIVNELNRQIDDMTAKGAPEEDIKKLRKERDGELQVVTGQRQQAESMRKERERMTSVGTYALDRTTKSYAEAGIAAMTETHNRKLQGNPIHVGPELGWPTFYGSHPDEFINVIKKSRKQMVDMLTSPERKENRMDHATAEDEARRHIKGVLDTSHLGMFFQTFMPNEPDFEKRTREFNKWFMEQINHIADVNAKDEILGNVQLVNSMSGAHGHLPPGQGIFPVVEAGKVLVERGKYKGYLTSEGHEEEKFQAGRILIDTWKSFNPNIMSSTGYSAGGARWTDVHQSYFGRPYSPMFVVGDYSPSQEFRLWSEVPLE
jgi:hypothetical protein